MIRDSILPSPAQPHAMSGGRVKELAIMVLGTGSAPDQVVGPISTHTFPGLSPGPCPEPQQANHRRNVCA